MSAPILVTKLFIPTARPKLVPRPRLTARLNKGLHRKLTLISAPAGFGKTTVVTEWLDHLQGESHQEEPIKNRVTWLSLDEGDNDPARFLTYFIAALNQIDGLDSLGEGSLTMLGSPQPPPIEVVLTPLINALAGITTTDLILFVLDDYHLVDTQPIQDILSFLIENLPPQLHLVITTREDPLLPVPRLRVRGQLTEIRAADLRFTTAEAAVFLNQVMGLNLSMEDIVALESQTEGWIAGLQLAAISMQGSNDATRFIQSFTGSNRLILDYLIEEVLNLQSEEIQKFLLQTAILDQICGELCNAVIGEKNSQQILEYLESANLFIISLDSERLWYRYHHLFADLLRQRLRQSQPEKIPVLHQRASQWYEQKDQTPDAIQHALAAEDFERVAALAELAWPKWSGNIQTITWLAWVDALPEELVRDRPVLSVAYAQALLNAGRLEVAEARLQDAELWLEPITEIAKAQGSNKMVIVDQEQFQALPAWLATTRAYLAQARGDSRSAVAYIKQALDLFPEDDDYNRAALTGLLGLAHWTSGDLKAAYNIFSDGLFQNVQDRIKGNFVLTDMLMGMGQLHEAERVCEQGIKLAEAYAPAMPLGTEDIYSGFSYVHREQGNLEAAGEDLRIARKLGEQVKLPDWEHRWCLAQAHLQETLGNLEEALDLLDDAERLFVRTPVPVLRPIHALKARIWLRQGQLDKALKWSNEQRLSVDDEISYLREFEHLTLARIHIARYRNEDHKFDHTEGLLGRLLLAAEEGERNASIMAILILQALIFDARGNTSSALQSLERALTLAEPEGYFQIFLAEGTPLARLLYEALSQKISPDYIQRLLAAFPEIEPEQMGTSQKSTPDSELIEPLSERELEVLQLIADGLKNQEIATQLYLSLNTVKAHTRSIYGKLDVNSRTQAVAKARSLGLISSN